MAIRAGVGQALVTKRYIGSSPVLKVYQGTALVADFSPAGPTRAFIRDTAITQLNVGAPPVLNRPANVVAGDLLVLIVSSDQGSLATHTPAPEFTAPTGTAEASGGTNAALVSISQRVATASEPATYTLAAYDTSGDGFAVMFAIGNVAGGLANTRVAAASSAASVTSVTSPTITPATAKSLNIRGFVHESSSGGITWTPGPDPQGYTRLYAMNHPAQYSFTAGFSRNYDSAAATGTQAFTFTQTPQQSRTGVGFNIMVASV